jgi:hypothetical protein
MLADAWKAGITTDIRGTGSAMRDQSGLRRATAGHDHWHRKQQNSGVEP